MVRCECLLRWHRKVFYRVVIIAAVCKEMVRGSKKTYWKKDQRRKVGVALLQHPWVLSDEMQYLNF